AFNALSGIPLIGESLAENVGVPIPLYLDEQLTGVYIESESKSIDVETETKPRFDEKKPEVRQTALNSLIAINMLAKKDAVLLSVLLALNDLIFTKVVSQNYRISYLNGATTVFNGLFHSF